MNNAFVKLFGDFVVDDLVGQLGGVASFVQLKVIEITDRVSSGSALLLGDRIHRDRRLKLVTMIVVHRRCVACGLQTVVLGLPVLQSLFADGDLAVATVVSVTCAKHCCLEFGCHAKQCSAFRTTVKQAALRALRTLRLVQKNFI